MELCFIWLVFFYSLTWKSLWKSFNVKPPDGLMVVPAQHYLIICVFESFFFINSEIKAFLDNFTVLALFSNKDTFCSAVEDTVKRLSAYGSHFSWFPTVSPGDVELLLATHLYKCWIMWLPWLVPRLWLKLWCFYYLSESSIRLCYELL